MHTYVTLSDCCQHNALLSGGLMRIQHALNATICSECCLLHVKVGTHGHASHAACKVCNICASSPAFLSLSAEDEDMKQMAQEETDKIRKQMQSLEAQLEVLLLPKDPLDERSIMLEVTAAVMTRLCRVS